MNELIQLTITLKQEIQSVLIHNAGDLRECPHCRTRFVPQDRTAEDAWKAYKKLRKVKI
jgi:hypothetical protein